MLIGGHYVGEVADLMDLRTLLGLDTPRTIFVLDVRERGGIVGKPIRANTYLRYIALPSFVIGALLLRGVSDPLFPNAHVYVR